MCTAGPDSAGAGRGDPGERRVAPGRDPAQGSLIRQGGRLIRRPPREEGTSATFLKGTVS
jgi:hypothetical protein